MDTFAGFLSVPPTSPGVIEVHTVRTETGKVFDDWVWFDEGDAVNVVVNGDDTPHRPAQRHERDVRPMTSTSFTISHAFWGGLALYPPHPCSMPYLVRVRMLIGC